MARNLYGAGTSDYAASSTGAPVAGATLTVYNVQGGTLITDLLTVTDNLYTAGGAVTSVTTTATGQYPFYGPDGENGTLYLKTTISGTDYWYAVNPSNEGDNRQATDGTVATLSTATTAQGTSLTTLAGRVTTLEGSGTVAPAWTAITGKPTTFPPDPHTHTTTDVTDLTTVGRALAKAADALTARTAIGAGTGNGTSNLTLGTLATQAAPGNHTHVATAIGFTPTGSVTATNAQDAIVQAAALGGTSGTADWSTITNIPSTFPPSAHTHPVSQVSDMTTVGRAVAVAPDAQTARAAIGAGTGNGTSNLILGTSSTTAAPGNHTHSAANLIFTPAAGNTATDVQSAIEQAMGTGSIGGASSIFVWQYAGGAWPVMPTTKPTGVLKVESEGPTQPTILPSWVGTGVGQATLYYEYSPRA